MSLIHDVGAESLSVLPFWDYPRGPLVSRNNSTHYNSPRLCYWGPLYVGVARSALWQGLSESWESRDPGLATELGEKQCPLANMLMSCRAAALPPDFGSTYLVCGIKCCTRVVSARPREVGKQALSLSLSCLLAWGMRV